MSEVCPATVSEKQEGITTEVDALITEIGCTLDFHIN